MSRNIVPRVNKGADLGTPEKNWNRIYADNVFLSGDSLKTILNNKADLKLLMAKGDLYTATGSGTIARLPVGSDGYVLKANSGVPEGLMWGPAGARQELTGNITVTVGSGGDFPTINAALANIVALYYPKYIANGNCPRVTIRLLSGFVMSEQVLVESLDLSWITITGVDDETVINRSALTTYWGSGYPAFGATNGGFLPIIGQLFNMGTSGTADSRHGILAYSNSRAIVLDGRGVKNAGSHGFYATYGSTIDAYSANASGAGSRGIYATYGSTINADGANASGAGTYGIYATLGSTINAKGANASGVGTYDIYVAYGSLINAEGVTGTLSQAKNTLTANGIIFQ